MIQSKAAELKPQRQHTDIAVKSHLNFIDQSINLVLSKELSWKDVGDESNGMIFAALETTATALYSILMCLSFYPEYQDSVYEEIVSVVPANEDITYQHIKELTLMEMVINETLRLLPAIPIVGRQVSKAIDISDDIQLPSGIQIVVSIFHIHRNKKYWGEKACVFNPNNFLPENIKSRNPFAFLPFAKGLRTCIGRQYAYMSLKVSFF